MLGVMVWAGSLAAAGCWALDMAVMGLGIVSTKRDFGAVIELREWSSGGVAVVRIVVAAAAFLAVLEVVLTEGKPRSRR
jgi:hypothetical protein